MDADKISDEIVTHMILIISDRHGLSKKILISKIVKEDYPAKLTQLRIYN
jgi:hypothetical protein